MKISNKMLLETAIEDLEYITGKFRAQLLYNSVIESCEPTHVEVDEKSRISGFKSDTVARQQAAIDALNSGTLKINPAPTPFNKLKKEEQPVPVPTVAERVKAAAEKLEIILEENEGQQFFFVNKDDRHFFQLLENRTCFDSQLELLYALEPLAELAHHMLRRAVAKDREEGEEEQNYTS